MASTTLNTEQHIYFLRITEKGTLSSLYSNTQ